ncbi:hypothetical protein H0H87_001263 [Tephrocybe sp. NHM501043]|nr:hypothetical protein H0H87_001263 [Tephrocybe sp. NHM501043]
MSLGDHISAPPGYSSQYIESSCQSSESRSVTSNGDLVSAQSHPTPLLPRSSGLEDTPRSCTDAQFHETIPSLPTTPRRRYTSLPHNTSSTFPQQLRYHYVRGTSISTTGPPEPPADATSPCLGRAQSSPSTTRLNPTNYVSLSRKSTARRRPFSIYRSSASITGKYTVNPYLHVPAALLSQASLNARDDTPSRHRKNLRFEVENGGIDVDIILVGEPTLTDRHHVVLRTTLDFKIKGGQGTTFPLITKIHTPDLPRPPFYLSASGIDGYHAVHIPPSFHGLITLTVVAGDLDSHMSLSRGFLANSLIMNETANVRSYFVGELGGWSRDKQGWEGDRIDVGVVRGMIRLQFLGEKDRDRLRRIRWKLGL